MAEVVSPLPIAKLVLLHQVVAVPTLGGIMAVVLAGVPAVTLAVADPHQVILAKE